MAATSVTGAQGGAVGTPVELIIGVLAALVAVLIVMVIGTVCLATLITKKKKTSIRNLQVDVLSRYQNL
jgi:ABC-type dipeptide/oligopeptide/nickel transport system permease subunit